MLDGIRRLTNSRLFRRDEELKSAWDVIAWWESRRIPYNLIVGTAGITTSLACSATAILCESFGQEAIGMPDPPIFAIFGVIAYGIVANVCYTGGWIAELIVLRVWRKDGKVFGKTSFRLGVMFSVALTFLPGVLVATVGAISLTAHVLGKK